MTPTHEHYIAKGNILPKFRDTITLPSALDLTGVTYQFIYSRPGVAPVTRSAILVSGTAKPNSTAATSFDLEYAPVVGDTIAEGVFNYLWRLTIPGQTQPLDVPTQVDPEVDGTPRKFQRFEVTPVLS